MVRISADASDTELVGRMRAGDKAALSVLYERYNKLVYSLAIKMLGRPSEAEDLTQEVFLTFWKQEKFDPNRAALSTYLCVVVRSRALNKLKSHSSRQRTLEKLQSARSPELSELTPIERASSLEKEETLRHALAQLPEKNRRVLEMNYYQGLSHTEISRQLEIPLGTVKTNARKGLILLRKLLREAVG